MSATPTSGHDSPRATTTSSLREQHPADPLYAELAASDDFRELRRRYRAFVFPCTVAFLAWYLLYVALSNWATDFMGTQVLGNINVGLVLGLLQFVSTFGIAYVYAKHASRRFDPLADRVRDRYDAEVRR